MPIGFINDYQVSQILLDDIQSMSETSVSDSERFSYSEFDTQSFKLVIHLAANSSTGGYSSLNLPSEVQCSDI
ncbi:unnamed protein product [Heterobilharzia americana]|nr:unnamed protein product [Heterobilharzia americana]